MGPQMPSSYSCNPVLSKNSREVLPFQIFTPARRVPALTPSSLHQLQPVGLARLREPGGAAHQVAHGHQGGLGGLWLRVGDGKGGEEGGWEGGGGFRKSSILYEPFIE